MSLEPFLYLWDMWIGHSSTSCFTVCCINWPFHWKPKKRFAGPRSHVCVCTFWRDLILELKEEVWEAEFEVPLWGQEILFNSTLSKGKNERHKVKKDQCLNLFKKIQMHFQTVIWLSIVCGCFPRQPERKFNLSHSGSLPLPGPV